MKNNDPNIRFPGPVQVTRRHMLLSIAAGGALSTARNAYASASPSTAAMALNSIFGIPSANAQALFDKNQPTAISSNANQSGTTQLMNLGGTAVTGFTQLSSASAFLSFYINAVNLPINTMPIFVVKDHAGNTIFLAEIWPVGHPFSYYDSLNGILSKKTTSRPNPVLRVLSAAVIRGSFRYANFFFELTRYWKGTWQQYRIFKNAIGADPASETVRLYHDLKGYSNPNAPLQIPFTGEFSAPSSTPLSPIPVSWGVTGGPQANFHIGADPTLGPNSTISLDASITHLTFAASPASPAWTQQTFLNGNGGFNRGNAYGGGMLSPNSAEPSIHLTGGGDIGGFPGSGFGFNNGEITITDRVRGDTLTIDPSFRPLPGFRAPTNAPDDIGSPFDD